MFGDKDYTFDAPYVQDPLHKLLYRGELFSFGFVTDSVNNGSSTKLLLNARSDDLTVLLGYGFSGNGHVHAYEVTSWTGGTAINPGNNYTKYYGVNSITSQIIRDPSSINVQVSSTPIWGQFVPGGTKASAVGAHGAVGEHFILGQGDVMLLEFENHSGGGATIGFDGVVYEVEIAQLDDPD